MAPVLDQRVWKTAQFHFDQRRSARIQVAIVVRHCDSCRRFPEAFPTGLAIRRLDLNQKCPRRLRASQSEPQCPADRSFGFGLASRHELLRHPSRSLMARNGVVAHLQASSIFTRKRVYMPDVLVQPKCMTRSSFTHCVVKEMAWVIKCHSGKPLSRK